MIMRILIFLLIMSIVLLVTTLLREKKQKRGRGRGQGRYAAKNVIKKTSTVFKEHSSRLAQQQEPTLTQMYPPTIDEEPSMTSDLQKQSTLMSQHPSSKIYPQYQKQSSAFAAISPSSQVNDTDVILGLKPATAPINKKVAEVENSVCVMESEDEEAMTKKSQLSSTSHIIIYLKASKDQVYGGYELLQTLLAHHFRYGEMDIFHRHERNTGEGRRLFSLAAATKRGTFDLNKIGHFTCSGLSLFFRLDQVQNPVLTFDLMLETVEKLRADLGGHLLDENQQELSTQMIQLIRENIVYWCNSVS